MTLLFDLILALTILAVAWRVVRTPDHFQAIVFFITFGLLLSLAWARLKSPDIALAEAAVGAGLAGVLLLDTLLAVTDKKRQKERKHVFLLLPFCLVLALIMVFAVLQIDTEMKGLSLLIKASLHETSLQYPVTAVLLDFRSYDTWLELGVLLAAVIGVLCVRRRSDVSGPLLPAPAEPVGRWLIRILLPVIILVGGYLLWLGAFAPGGAFQAGVVWASGGVLLWQAGHHSLGALPAFLWRICLILGFISFLFLAAAAELRQEFLLTHPSSKIWILVVEYAAALSIAFCLASLVLGGLRSVHEKT